MTERQLKIRVYLVLALLFSIYAIALAFRFILHNEDEYASVKDFSPIFIAIGGAYLAFCFQRRQTFLTSLRDLWKEMILSKIAVMKFIEIDNPSTKDFDSAYEQVSKTIHLVRSVYVNEQETEVSVGLYPFQPLREMLHILRAANSSGGTIMRRNDARDQLDRAWEALRWSFLPEFSRPAASNPIVSYDAKDPRR